MQDRTIVNWNYKKLLVFIILLIIAQIACILIGKFAPRSTTIQNVIATACRDNNINGNKSELTKWYYTRGNGSCEVIDIYDNDSVNQLDEDIVYSFQIPLPRNGKSLNYSRWHQYLRGLLQIDIAHNNKLQIGFMPSIVLYAKLAYRNKGDADNAWKSYAVSTIERNLDCLINNNTKEYFYDCQTIPLFELGPLFHDYYLLNIRIPIIHREKNINQGLNYITDISLITVNQSGSFTKVWVYIQSCFLPITICFLAWYWRRVHIQSRSPVFFEYMTLTLGLILTFFNIPFEYLMLYIDTPSILLLNDIKQVLLYATLLSYILIFIDEHLMIKNRSGFKNYRRHLYIALFTCLFLFLFDICRHIVQLNNPFFPIWITNISAKLTLSFIIFTGIMAGLYILFLTCMIWNVFVNIWKIITPNDNSPQPLYGKCVMYRFIFMIIITLICALLTIIRFIFVQMAQGQWTWVEDYELDTTSAFFISVYGMWNIYTIAILCLYAPINK